MNDSCPITCRSSSYLPCTNDKQIKGMSICQNSSEEECFNKALKNSSNEISLKPCTKLQYHVEANMHKNFKLKQRSVIFKFEFSDPARVTVKEEYLLFDMVSMISSIGGTMGLCVGLSFLEIYSISRGLVQHLFRQIMRHNQKRMKQRDCQPESAVKTVSVEEQRSTCRK